MENTNVQGKINIADDVVASIAGIATVEVNGVAKLNGNIEKSVIGKIGKKALSKSVKIDIVEDKVIVDLSIIIEYGANVKTVSEEIQTNVKKSIETMTGLTVEMVNVVVTGIQTEKED